MASNAVFFKKNCNQELHCQDNQESQESYNLVNGAHTSSSTKRVGAVVDNSKSGCRLIDLMERTTPTVATEILATRIGLSSTATTVFNGRTKVVNDGFTIEEHQRWSTAATVIGETTMLSRLTSTVSSSMVSLAVAMSTPVTSVAVTVKAWKEEDEDKKDKVKKISFFQTSGDCFRKRK